MEKCAVCGMQIDTNPCLDEEGKCNICNKKLCTEESKK